MEFWEIVGYGALICYVLGMLGLCYAVWTMKP